jgi:hypothetical protein
MSTFTASESLAAFFDGLRATGSPLVGTNAQLTQLLHDALSVTHTDTSGAEQDVDNLVADLTAILETWDGEEKCYPDDED